MRTISVREAADVLGITPRAVTYRLEKKQLKGFLKKNDQGSPEWRIYPTRELVEGLQSLGKSGESTFIDAESVIDAENFEAVEGEEAYFDAAPAESHETRRGDWIGQEREFTKRLVEEIIRPHLETIQQQAQALVEKDRIIEDKERQLRLLPDLQKMAEEDRKSAELKELEVEALKKQIEAMEAESKTAEELEKELAALKQQVDELRRPWWKWWFNSSTV